MPEPTATESAAIPKTKPTVEVVHAAGKHRGLVLAIGVDGDRVVAVGGQGSDLLLMSDNGGKKFRATSSGGGGLRGVLVHGEHVVVVGEYGHVAGSHNFGETWTKVTLKTRACLFGVVEDARSQMWIAGDSGFVARSRDDGAKFTRVNGISEYIGRISNSTLGVLVPTDAPGHLFIREAKSFRQTAAESGADLMAARVTPRGTLIVVGAGGAILRSTNRGETFERVTIGMKDLLAGIDWLPDGRVVVTGDNGTIYVSYDDGESFKKLPVETKSTLWCAQRHGDSVLVGGADGLVLRLS